MKYVIRICLFLSSSISVLTNRRIVGVSTVDSTAHRSSTSDAIWSPTGTLHARSPCELRFRPSPSPTAFEVFPHLKFLTVSHHVNKRQKSAKAKARFDAVRIPAVDARWRHWHQPHRRRHRATRYFMPKRLLVVVDRRPIWFNSNFSCAN